MFRASSAHLQEDTVVYMQHMILSLSMRVTSNVPHHTERHAHITNVMLPHHHDWLLRILNSVIF